MANISARQWGLAVFADLTVTTAATTQIDVPPGTMVTGGVYSVFTAATGTTPTLSMQDDAGTPNVYLSAVAIGAVANGVLAAAKIGTFYPSGARFTFTTGGTTPAGGRILVLLQYVILLRQNELYKIT